MKTIPASLALGPVLLGALSLLPLCARAQATSTASESSFTLGAGVAFGPRFMGSKENQASPALVADYQHSSGFFASSLRGIGWGGGSDALKYSLALSLRGERDEKNEKGGLGGKSGGKELLGMGKVKSSALGLFTLGSQVHKRLGLHAALELPLSHRENGRALHLGGSLQLLQGPRDTVALDFGASWGDNKYQRTYFGVNAQQSQNTGYAIYTPKSGFYQSELSLNWSRQLNERWGLTSVLGVSHLLGDAADSPLARRKTAPQGAVFVTYRY